MEISKNHNLYVLRAYEKNDSAIKLGYSSNINHRIVVIMIVILLQK